MKTSASPTRLAILLLCAINTAWAQSLDTRAVKSIALKIDPKPLADLGLSAPYQPLAARISENLAQRQLPMRPDAGQTYTHTLDVTVGKASHDGTPPGFSFSLGNSDPRSPGFQKADVIPIQCRLRANADPSQQADLTMTFNALAPPASADKWQASLVEDISTVCYELLDSLHLYQPSPAPAAMPSAPGLPQAATPVAQPAWMPAVKIETVQEPPPKPDTVNPADPIKAVPSEERKQLIIRNQGTPLIIKWGHERL